MAQTPTPPSNWWMYHGDPAHSGVATGSTITAQNVSQLKPLYTLQLQGPVMSVPAIVDGFAYVGTANTHLAPGGNGGSMNKIELATGKVVASYVWPIKVGERDSHGFTGMGCTPAVSDGRVIFSAFDGRVYCLDQKTLDKVWITDLRHADPEHNQPVENTVGQSGDDPDYPPCSGWSSPVVANGCAYIGVGEGENPKVCGFVYCLDCKTGNVKWLFCTNKFSFLADNQPNVIPALVAVKNLPPGFSKIEAGPITMGSSVWSAIAHDTTLNRLYCSTGNPSPDGPLPTLGYTNGILALDAATGAFVGFAQFDANYSYRPSDSDVDVGGAPTLFTRDGVRYVGAGCKNGCYMVLDATTLKIVAQRQMLPYMKDGSQIPTVDPHGPDDPSAPNPRLTNQQSNNFQQENFFGTYSTAAVHASLGRIFIGIGGNNYHYVAPGIDYETTPFMRAMDWTKLADAWPMDDNDPKRYLNCRPPMYTTPAESGLSVPAVVNDVVFMGTSAVSLYAFNANDGTPLWSDPLGMQTDGQNGGYGYCLGAAISGNYVVAGALILGRDGGVLKIYGFPPAPPPPTPPTPPNPYPSA